ncbi:MAG: FCD domain-containing protein [Streptosporangiales bacterium]|nr:FCD domain-containing protein [Streptosporangiales bacterium]
MLTETTGDRRSGSPQATGRDSTASRIASALRDRITAGGFQPGDQLPEERISAGLGVSRNTLREGLQVLVRERLLVHRLNRGMFVREPTPDDVRDLYRARRLIECGALREADSVPVRVLRALRAAVESGQRAAAEGRWRDVANASIALHQAIAGLAGSERTDDTMRGLLAEFRLAYAVMTDPRAFHEPYLRRHPSIVEPITAGDLATAEARLRDYLRDAERQVLAAFPR